MHSLALVFLLNSMSLCQHGIIFKNIHIFISIIWSVNGASEFNKLSICVQNYFNADITVAPSSVSAPLYTLANFTCEGTGDKLSWTVGGNSLSDPSNQDREISVIINNNISVGVWSSELTIRALPINDGITVGCAVISYNTLVYIQKGASLNVKGIHLFWLPFHVTSCLTGVSSVPKLVFFFLGALFSLSWSSPSFYSNDIPHGSITTYHVYVKSQDGSVIIDDNTTDTFYQLPNNITVCRIYTASVIAFIEDYSSIVTTITEQNTGSKIILNTHLMFIIVLTM